MKRLGTANSENDHSCSLRDSENEQLMTNGNISADAKDKKAENSDVAEKKKTLNDDVIEGPSSTTDGHFDRGWAWLVMVAAFANTLFIMTFERAWSMLFLHFLKRYSASTTMTTLAVSLSPIMFALSSILQPILLMPRFEIRTIAVVGSIIQGTCKIVISLSPNILVLTIAYAANGFSNGLVFIPQTAIISHYFKKRLSTAMAFVTLGLSIATMAGPPFTQVLLDSFGLQGALLLLAGINLNGIPASMLFRPVHEKAKEIVIPDPPQQEEGKSENTEPISRTEGDEDKEAKQTTDLNKSCEDLEAKIPLIPEKEEKLDLLSESSSQEACSTDLEKLTKYDHCTEHSDLEVLLVQGDDGDGAGSTSKSELVVEKPVTLKETNIVKETGGEGPEGNSYPDNNYRPSVCEDNDQNEETSLLQEANTETIMVENTLQNTQENVSDNVPRQQNFASVENKQTVATTSKQYSTNEQNSTNMKKSTNKEISMSDNSMKYEKGEEKVTGVQQVTHSERDRSLCSEIKARMLNSPFTRPSIMLLIFASAIGIHTNSIFAYVPALGLENGLTEAQTSLLLTVSGSCDLVSKILIGLFGDLRLVQPITVVVATQMILGLSLQLVSLYQGLELMMLMQVIVGLTTGVYYVLLPVIIVDLLGKEYIAHVFSGMFLINGGVSTIDHMVTGILKDETGSFYVLFNYLGGQNILGGLLLPLTSLLVALERKKGKDKDIVEFTV